MADWKGDVDAPLVSVSCITYNHEPYIKDALNGFLMQETDFPFEVLIHDDASTDKTADIIREYETRYPKIIKPIYQTENQHSQGIKISFTYQYPRARGEYIALCEGDDYWIDPLKLKKQSVVLDKNCCPMCSHSHYILDCRDHSTKLRNRSNLVNRHGKISKNYSIIIAGGLFATSSLFFRSEIVKENPEWMKKWTVGDVPLILRLSDFGDFFYLNTPSSCYRYFTRNSWTERSSKKTFIQVLINEVRSSKLWMHYAINSPRFVYHFVIFKIVYNFFVKFRVHLFSKS